MEPKWVLGLLEIPFMMLETLFSIPLFFLPIKQR